MQQMRRRVIERDRISALAVDLGLEPDSSTPTCTKEAPIFRVSRTVNSADSPFNVPVSPI
jgi:hypothetical protein